MNNFDVLEERIVQLLNKLKENHLLINKLQTENQQFEQESSSLKTQISELKKESESLKMANSLLGSKESKAITKRKINSLIKEVDFCIHQLSDIR
jgi:phage shock protein A